MKFFKNQIQYVSDGLDELDFPGLLFSIGVVNIGAMFGVLMQMDDGVLTGEQLAALYGIVGIVLLTAAFKRRMNQ